MVELVRSVKDGIVRIFNHCIIAGVFQGHPCYIISHTSDDWSADAIRNKISNGGIGEVYAILVINNFSQELPPILDIAILDGLGTQREINFGVISSFDFELETKEVAMLEKIINQLREKNGDPVVSRE